MRRGLSSGAATAFVLAWMLGCPREAGAQLHWDASLQAGAMKRVLTERPTGSDDAGIGPTAQLAAHVALLPLVHAGGYVAHDISPLPGAPAARSITSGGIRARGMLPWVSGSMRAWLFVGLGYAGVYAPSYEQTLAIGPARIQGAGGSFFEVPFGIGASYKLSKPWELCAELGARAGFGHTGTVYDPPGPRILVPGEPNQYAEPSGLDRFAVGLTVGVMLDL